MLAGLENEDPHRSPITGCDPKSMQLDFGAFPVRLSTKTDIKKAPDKSPLLMLRTNQLPAKVKPLPSILPKLLERLWVDLPHMAESIEKTVTRQEYC